MIKLIKSIIGLIFGITLVFVISCTKDQALNSPVSNMDNKSTIQSGQDVHWTMTVDYPYDVSDENISYSNLNRGSSMFWYIPESHNGFSVGWGYQGKLDVLTFSVGYSFPSGVSEFIQNPNLNVTLDMTNVTVDHIYPDGQGWVIYESFELGKIDGYNPSEAGFSCWTSALYVEYNPYAQWIGEEYPNNLNTIKIDYEASGRIEKSTYGWGTGTYYIDSGVSGLNINDVNFDLAYTPYNGNGVAISSKWINGTRIYFTLIGIHDQDGAER
ncbi:MAG: hypothetical protein GXO75_17250 [Calditrichaeota bacterium]|nr:hypothetical protein [Calditrichota bacterium]